MKSSRNKYREKIFFLLMILLTISVSTNCNKKRANINRKKQIILISVDTLRADHLSCYGYSRDTSPALSKLVKDAVCCTQAYPNGCWTIPSHVSLLTGTLPSRHGVNKTWQSIKQKQYPILNDSIKSVSEIFKQYGLNTIKFAALPDELGFCRGFDINNRIDPFANEKIFNKLLGQLEENKNKEFFLFIHTWQVHAPYTRSYFLKKEKAGKEKRKYIDNFRTIFKKKQSKNIPADFLAFLKENNLCNVKDCIDLYDSGIHYVDGFIGRILDKVRQLNIYDDLFFIVVSDHGEHFAEHYKKKFYGHHGVDYFEEFIKVPLIIKYPGTNKSEKISEPVSLVDVLPTVLDYYNMEIPGFVQGDSLLIPYPKRTRKYIISEAIAEDKVEKKMIRVGDLKYIITMRNPSKPERINWDSIVRRRLYDLRNDPLEKNNLYKNLKFRQICIDFEKILVNVVTNSAKTDFSINKTKISEKTIKDLAALGYL